jgi:hypothetical protein
MASSADAHEPLRREWAETPPDVSYRFVVSLGTLRAADSVARAVAHENMRWWRRANAFFVRDTSRFILGGLLVALFGWMALQAALAVDRALDVTQRFGTGTLLPIVTFLLVFLGLLAGFRIAVRRLTTLPLQRLHREFYAGNEFLLEGRPSHLWFDEQSAGAIRRWSTFKQPVEFDEGLWLLLRRRTTFAGQRGILISKESLPGSCPWSELTAYLRQRITDAASDEASLSAPGQTVHRSSSRVT